MAPHLPNRDVSPANEWYTSNADPPRRIGPAVIFTPNPNPRAAAHKTMSAKAL
jgi:hypothetical protein